MKILTPQQIKQADNYTIERLPILSIDLMERAAIECVNFITKKVTKPDNILVFCGKGNNGGDGLAIARLLLLQNYLVEVFIVEYSFSASSNFEVNLKRFKGKITLIEYIDNWDISATKNTLIIDCVLGSGLNKPITGLIKELIKKLNQLPGYKLSIDIATGLSANNTFQSDQTIFKPQQTLTFQAPKLNFMMKENYPFVGNFEILNIGWHLEADKDLPTEYYYTMREYILSIYKKRDKFVSKYDFGHALILAGSFGKAGAALLSTRACLRSGAGLTTIYSCACVYTVLQSQAPEAMFMADTKDEYISALPDLKRFNAIAIGPGIGLHPKTKLAVIQLIEEANMPLVIDADAINVLAENKTVLPSLKPNSILTPHFKEFERLTKKVDTDYERLLLAIEFAKTYSIVLVLKGVYTAVINADGKVYFNSTGNSSLAKGGSGDTLTGIIVAYLAKGYTPLEAAIISVYIHGLAADICVKQQGTESVLATDLIEALKGCFF